MWHNSCATDAQQKILVEEKSYEEIRISSIADDYGSGHLGAVGCRLSSDAE
jgi:hypothetical protein